MAYATITEGVAVAQVAAQQPVAMAALDEQGRYPFLADSFTVTDSINLVRTLFRTAADSVNMSDALAREFHRPLQDSVAITEARTSAATIPRTDTTTVTDSLTTAMNYARSLSDSIEVIDELGYSNGQLVMLNDGITITEAHVAVVTTPRADTATISDVLTTSLSMPRAHTDSVTITDAVVKAVGKTLAETVTAADSGAYQVYNYGSNDYFAEEYVLAATGTF